MTRFARLVLSVVPGFIVGGFIAYGAAWALLPVERQGVSAGTARRLQRSIANRKIAGVCGGLADYFGVDSTLVRVAAIVLAIYPGAIICGVLVYVVAWFVMPSAPAAAFHPSPSTP